MKLLRTSLLLLPLLLACAAPLRAEDKPRVSPTDTVTATIGGANIKVVYGRPFTKDPKTGEPRKVWGGLVPFGQVWRTGANEATLLTTDKSLIMGSTTVPAGSYSIFAVPTADGGKLIINKQTGQWGTKYDEAQDLARVDMKKAPLSDATHQFTIAIDENGKEGGTLNLMWEDTQYSVPFTVGK
ncbi:DUF2911 domain-containing protein [soil metagenome]